jgi:hypothetical protein
MKTTWTERAVYSLETERNALWREQGTSNRNEYIIRECNRNGGLAYAKTAAARFAAIERRVVRIDRALRGLARHEYQYMVGLRVR